MALKILLVLLCTVSSTAAGFFYKMGSARGKDNRTSPALLCTVYMAFTSAVYTVLAFTQSGGYRLGMTTVLCGCLTGFCFAVAAYLYLVAFSMGPFTPTVLIMNMSSFMPIIYSCIFLGESITPLQIIGSVLMVAVVITLSIAKKPGKINNEKTTNAKWVLIMILTFMTNGILGFGIRLQGKLVGNTHSFEFYSITFLVGTLVSLVIFLIVGGLKARQSIKPLLVPALGLGVIIGSNVLISLKLTTLLPAAVQYPVVNGVSILLSTAMGKFLFKDKLPPIAYVAVAVGIGAIVMLGI